MVMRLPRGLVWKADAELGPLAHLASELLRNGAVPEAGSVAWLHEGTAPPQVQSETALTPAAAERAYVPPWFPDSET